VRVHTTELPGVLIIEPQVFADPRGWFAETYHARRYQDAGIPDLFVQDNQSHSVRGTIRGLHLQVERPQAKLIRVVQGEILDVAVDVRVGSPTFGRWVGVVLSAQAGNQCFVPAGFAHGFSVLSDSADVGYKCTAFYDKPSEVGVAWDDPAIGIDWRISEPVVSDRDRRNPPLAQLMDRLPRYPSTVV
jgi:dTDP-4-dehydrorhamnose 3,5-epimerase